MNILELCLSPGLGGLELYVFRSAQALAENNHVLAVLNTAGKLTDYFNAHSDIEASYLEKSSKVLPLFNARKLAAIIDRNEIDVIHMHWGNDLALAALAKKLSRGKPALVYTRQMKITRYKTDFYHRLLYDQMDLMLTITRQLEKEARTFIPGRDDRITTLYYGVNAPAEFLSHDEIRHQRSELGFNDDDFVTGLLGRLEKGKGQHLLIEALAMARRDGLEPKALIVGHEMNPGYRSELLQQARTLDVDSNIVFMDFVPEPQKVMQLCDCIALTSREETFGLVLPEAMRCGIAVIGSNKGGVPEIITHKKTGLLFESWNSASLYKQIHRLYTDADFRKALAANGKIDADSRFNTEDHFSSLERHLIDAAH
ncbi:MAG: glycosyltransferase family 4 protein [Thiotrichales bacterium]|nr:MAG: glycosyltransferase family 4 protein [Thiotrichales bacterium]